MRVVVALGGNALLPPGEPLEWSNQFEAASHAAEALASLVDETELILTHGNGPQVGLLALESMSYEEVGVYPLEVLVAESQGMIGYLIEAALDRVVDRPIVTVLTRVLVSDDDPAFGDPTKPIGPTYDRDESEDLAERYGWDMAEQDGRFRRVVPSPEPVRVLACDQLRSIVESGAIVVCCGGGGIPVSSEGGVEAVIDKDLASSLLAIELDADVYVSLTDVPAVFENWGTPDARAIARIGPEELRKRDFAEGSMGPKVTAACRFAERTGKRAAIGSLEDAAAVVRGEAGTQVDADATSIDWHEELEPET